MNLPVTGAVDLSKLQQKQADETYTCTVQGGCGLTLRRAQHFSLEDCVLTCVGYVGYYLDLEPAAVEMEKEIIRLRKANNDLLAANQRLLAQADEKGK